MKNEIRRIGILTGGGDCPGLNAVIRAVTKAAIFQHDISVLGIEDGFKGLLEDRVQELDTRAVSGMLTRGGTILGTNNRTHPSRIPAGTDAAGADIFEDRTADCLQTIERHGLDALVLIGGDGTMSCSTSLVAAGVNCIGIPKTIDNDLIGTDITFGFTTAYTTATLALDRLHSTAASHHRVMVCEVMGRNAGWLALHAGLASGSDVILIPEIPFLLDHICEFVSARQQGGRGFSIVTCAEGVQFSGEGQVVARHIKHSHEHVRLGGIGAEVAMRIEEQTGIETRTTVLGHVQRGGPPVAADRVLASRFGYGAIQLLVNGGINRMIVMKDGDIRDIPLEDVVEKQRLVPTDHPLIRIARSVGTCFGDCLPAPMAQGVR